MKGVDRIKCFFVIGTRMFLNKVPKRKDKKASQYCDYKPSCFTYIISAVCNKNQLYGMQIRCQPDIFRSKVENAGGMEGWKNG